MKCKHCNRVMECYVWIDGLVYSIEEVIELGLNVDMMDWFYVCGWCEEY
jgi:hypothetical protein